MEINECCTIRNTLIFLAILVLAGGIFRAGNMVVFTNGFGTGWVMGTLSLSYFRIAIIARPAFLHSELGPGSCGAAGRGNLPACQEIATSRKTRSAMTIVDKWRKFIEQMFNVTLSRYLRYPI